VAAAHAAPYLATALLALQPVVLEDLHEAGIDPADLRAFPVDRGWRVHLDAATLSTTPPPVLAFWLVHHVGHLLREHAERSTSATGQDATVPLAGRSPEQRRWGIAADCEVNDDLPATLRPGGEVTPAEFGLPDGETAEQYWTALADVPEGHLARARDCGSGSDGVVRAWDAGEPGVGSEESRLLRQEVARRIAARARGQGDVPETWQRWADEVLEPTVDWRRELAAAIRRGAAAVAGRLDYTYRRPSRRAAAVPGVVLPGLHQPVPRVCVVLDTSQSMSGALLARAVAEVGGVLRALGIGRSAVRVLCCDTAAQEPARVLDAREIRLVGGGGTDLRAGLAAAGALRPRADLVVVLTDGLTDWPEVPPRGCSVVVGVLDSGRRAPDWARTVDIPLERS
jgi:predicted metal-dependent peptidase